jgi:hypothetical protein
MFMMKNSVHSFNCLNLPQPGMPKIWCEIHVRISYRNTFRQVSVLVGKSDGKRPLGRPRHRWIDNIKMVLSEIGLSVVYWIGLAQDWYRWRALVNAVMNLRVP